MFKSSEYELSSMPGTDTTIEPVNLASESSPMTESEA